jgi:hypothetical protein
MIGTGHALEPHNLRFVGTVQIPTGMNGGELVLHVFEKFFTRSIFPDGAATVIRKAEREFED